MKVNTIIEGKFLATSKGSGFIQSEDSDDDIYIYRNNVNQAFNNDTIKVRIIEGRQRGTIEAKVIEIIKRDKVEFVGTIDIRDNYAFVRPDSRKMNIDFFISKGGYKGIKQGEKVVVKFLKWKEGSRSPNGRIIKKLGKAGDNDVEIFSIMHEYGFQDGFSENVENEVSKIGFDIPDEEIKKRRDFRDVLTTSIDPLNAKDKDDALSFKELKNGDIEIGVHIADVSHYVTKDSELDKEAYTRGTSVYLVDRVIPMLPELLSNGICSLNEGFDKLSYSFLFTFDKNYNPKKKWFGRGIINMDKSMSYEEAQSMIDNNETSDVAKSLIILNKVAKKLRKERDIIEFNRQEIRFKLDKNAKPIGVYVKKTIDTNKLIEEFMLLTNREVGEFVAGKKTPFIYRAHDEPDIERLVELSNFIKEFGYEMNPESNDVKKELNKLLKDVKGTNEENLISTLAVRTMSKANCTSKENHSHYGLSMKHYSWMTSPIRRYADLVAHRILSDVLGNNGYDSEHSTKKSKYTQYELEKICDHINTQEKNASKAERDSIKFKQVEFLMDKIGQEFDAVVSGIKDWGVYCEIIDNKCEGMVSRNDLEGLGFNISASEHKLSGDGMPTIHLGDTITIMVKSVSLMRKEIEYIIVT